MTGLVDNVVDFTRGRMGSGLALDLSRHNDVDLVLDQVVDELRGVYPDRAITSSIARGIDLRCDPQRLAQLLSNLLKNALVHGDPAHPIAVEAGIDDAGFILVVNNRGPQLGPDIIAQLFKPYWRAISRPGDEGLGLGLYISRQLAISHGGELRVTSKPGEGSVFSLVLPCTDVPVCAEADV